MSYSQKLYRFVNTVELVSPHHSAKEIMTNLKEGQITSLFQKSLKRVRNEDVCLLFVLQLVTQDKSQGKRLERQRDMTDMTTSFSHFSSTFEKRRQNELQNRMSSVSRDVPLNLSVPSIDLLQQEDCSRDSGLEQLSTSIFGLQLKDSRIVLRSCKDDEDAIPAGLTGDVYRSVKQQ